MKGALGPPSRIRTACWTKWVPHRSEKRGNAPFGNSETLSLVEKLLVKSIQSRKIGSIGNTWSLFFFEIQKPKGIANWRSLSAACQSRFSAQIICNSTGQGFMFNFTTRWEVSTLTKLRACWRVPWDIWRCSWKCWLMNKTDEILDALNFRKY